MNSFNLILKKRPNKNGNPILFVSTLRRKSVIKTLNISVLPNFWDAKNQLIKNNSVEAIKLNLIKQKALGLQMKLFALIKK